MFVISFVIAFVTFISCCSFSCTFVFRCCACSFAFFSDFVSLFVSFLRFCVVCFQFFYLFSTFDLNFNLCVYLPVYKKKLKRGICFAGVAISCIWFTLYIFCSSSAACVAILLLSDEQSSASFSRRPEAEADE